MKEIDKIGRIVIPKELRKKYGISEGVKIAFCDTGDGISIKVCEPICKICHAKISNDRELPLCDKCTFEVVNSYYENK
ncbi:MAG: hypothetical protein E7671_06465 [Ruminococcaceae bacterium]|nr:hypothetical protein [Oscillospiraceae bacterium]